MLVPPLQPFEPAAQRNRILRAVPPQHARDEVFENILAPALKEVEHKLGQTVRIADVKEYGVMPESPLASIVIPLYRNLDFLRFQLSAMATDPWLADECRSHFRARFSRNSGRYGTPAGRPAYPARHADEACHYEPQQWLRSRLQCRCEPCEWHDSGDAELGRCAVWAWLAG